MAVASTATFNLDLNELTQEAFERAGLDLRTGYDLKTAKRSLNLLALEWQNRGLNLWTIEEQFVAFVEGTDSYTLDADTIDIIDAVIRTDPGNTSKQIDAAMSRISPVTYATIPNKLTKGRPNQYWVDRQRDAPVVYVYPTASSTYSTARFVFWRERRILDTGDKGSNDFDVPARFIPALVAGLAYNIALKKPEAAGRISGLKQDYEEQYNIAAGEDRVKAPLRMVPFTEYYGG